MNIKSMLKRILIHTHTLTYTLSYKVCDFPCIAKIWGNGNVFTCKQRVELILLSSSNVAVDSDAYLLTRIVDIERHD